ncbi:MAG TPA: tyrosine-type recombinase/integrase [Propionibacteriaceae bacterium]|nr:tyrosine-type recombinase/integrase [Propionibacteriaceae bacterium]
MNPTAHDGEVASVSRVLHESAIHSRRGLYSQLSRQLPAAQRQRSTTWHGQAGGLRFHDLRHFYATWLVDDGVPPNMVQRVMGHERATTTLDLYTRRTDNADRILEALSDDDAD